MDKNNLTDNSNLCCKISGVGWGGWELICIVRILLKLKWFDYTEKKIQNQHQVAWQFFPIFPTCLLTHFPGGLSPASPLTKHPIGQQVLSCLPSCSIRILPYLTTSTASNLVQDTITFNLNYCKNLPSSLLTSP